MRPVCPWFVVFAKWSGQDHWSMFTPADLEKIGVTPSDVSWHVVVANRKAYNITLALEDIVYAKTDITGPADGYGDARKGLIEKLLVGRSDMGYWDNYSELSGQENRRSDNQHEWLIPENEKGFALGKIQAPLVSNEFGIRLRFVPPPGAVYGPTNLPGKVKELLNKMSEGDRKRTFDDWNKLKILECEEQTKKYCILSAKSAWAKKTVGPRDEVRTLPGPQFAHIAGHSLGLMDDFSDGIVTVRLELATDKLLEANARIVVGPPDLAPDRRHPVTLFDSLDDRAYLASFSGTGSYEGYPNQLKEDQLRDEVLDLFRRAHETAGLTNVDAMNHRFSEPFREETKRTAPGNLPLTHHAREKHRRLASLETLEDTLREHANRKLARRVVLEPGTDNDERGLFNLPPGEDGEVPSSNFWNRMLPLLRGSHFAPMHLTKRQIEVLRRWLSSLKKSRT